MNTYEVDIPKPDPKDSLSWATVSQTRIDWLRAICPRIGFDTTKVILGEGLGDIYGDDPNAFGLYFIPDIVDSARKMLQIVMDTRINTPELPTHIRERLTSVRDHILSIDWSTKEGYDRAKRFYKLNAGNFVQHQIATHKEYQEAWRYSHEISGELSPPWQDFLYGSHDR